MRYQVVIASIVLFLALSFSPASGRTQNQASAGGRWGGALDAEGMKQVVAVDLSQAADGKWTGKITVPVTLILRGHQEIRDVALANVTVKGSIVSFEVPGILGSPSFKGTLSDDGKVISGELTRSGKSLPFKLERVVGASYVLDLYGPTPAKGVAGQGLAGNWQGSLEAGGATLRVVLKVSTTAGAITAKLDNPDQGTLDWVVDSITLKGQLVHFELNRLSAVYDGTLSNDGSEVLGQWQQGGGSLPLNLKRLAKK